MKYVMLRERAVHMIGTSAWPEGGQVGGQAHDEIPIIFPDSLTHSEVVRALNTAYPGLVATSAGFVNNTEEGFACHGMSESLGLRSADYDGHVMDDLMNCALDDIP